MGNSYGKQYGSFLKKLKIESSYDPQILLLGMYTEVVETGTPTDICKYMFTVTLLTVAKR